jgi:hypothetical protein
MGMLAGFGGNALLPQSITTWSSGGSLRSRNDRSAVHGHDRAFCNA